MASRYWRPMRLSSWAPRANISVGGFDGGEGRVGPFGRLGEDGVNVGIEEEGSV